jgi:hypothetical protein
MKVVILVGNHAGGITGPIPRGTAFEDTGGRSTSIQNQNIQMQ